MNKISIIELSSFKQLELSAKGNLCLPLLLVKVLYDQFCHDIAEVHMITQKRSYLEWKSPFGFCIMQKGSKPYPDKLRPLMSGM